MKKAEHTEPPSRVHSTANDQVDICFTIMPFGGWYDEYYKQIFVPAIQEAGLESRRADDLYRPGTIVHDIWAYTKQAKVVLADLTGKNPNVLYELGLAHAIAKPVILVAQTLSDIPFDLRALRVIEYDKDAPNWGDILGAKITQSIKELLKAPLKSILPAFLEVDESKAPKKVTPQEKQLLEIQQELDLLKQEIRGVPRSVWSTSRPHSSALLHLLDQALPSLPPEMLERITLQLAQKDPSDQGFRVESVVVRSRAAESRGKPGDPGHAGGDIIDVEYTEVDGQ